MANSAETNQDYCTENLNKETEEIKQQHSEEVNKLEHQISVRDAEILLLKMKIKKLEQEEAPEESKTSVDGKTVESDMRKRVLELEGALRERDNEISFVKSELKQSREELAQLRKALVETDSTIADLLDKNGRLEHEVMIYKELAVEKEEELTREINEIKEQKDIHVQELERELFDTDIKLDRLKQTSEEKIDELKHEKEKLLAEYEETVDGLMERLCEKDAECLRADVEKEKKLMEVEKELFNTKVQCEQMQKDILEFNENEMELWTGLKELERRLLKKKEKTLTNLRCFGRGKKRVSKLDIVQNIIKSHYFAPSPSLSSC